MLNIQNSGVNIQKIKSAERNYFRLYPGSNSVEIIPIERIPDRIDVDEIYVLEDEKASGESRKLDKLGFKCSGRWHFGDPGVVIGLPFVAKYEKNAGV